MGTETEPEGARPKRWFSELRAWSAKEPLQAATAAGALTYASFRIAFLFFYNRFGVTPEEVGHSYSSTLAQALVGAIAIFAVLMLSVGAWSASVALVGLQMFRRDPSTAWVVAAASVIGGAMITSYMRQVAPFPPTQLTIIFLTSSGAFFVVTSMSFEGMVEQWTWRASSRARSALPRVMLGGGLIVLFVVMPVLASIDARAVYSGKTRRSQLAGVLGLPWAADVARVEWLDESEAAATGSVRCFMYLGRSDGIAVLWDPVQRASYRIPAARITLISGDAESCAPQAR